MLGPPWLVTKDLGTQITFVLANDELITLVAQIQFLASLSDKSLSIEELDLGMLPIGQFLPICPLVGQV